MLHSWFLFRARGYSVPYYSDPTSITVKILFPSKQSSQYSLVVFLKLFIQRDSGCLTYLRKQWARAGFFIENTVWIKQHENRSMKCMLKKQIFHFSSQTHQFLVEGKKEKASFLSFQITWIPSCFYFYFHLMFPSGKEQFWSGLFFQMLKCKFPWQLSTCSMWPLHMEQELLGKLAC